MIADTWMDIGDMIADIKNGFLSLDSSRQLVTVGPPQF